VKHAKIGKLKTFLEDQDAYTLHRPIRKRFPRNCYSVTNIMDVWETGFQNLGKHNDHYKYLVTVIDVFSKYLQVIPIKSKTGPAATAAFCRFLKTTNILNLYGRDQYERELTRKNNF
jgi:hypothetical protein